MKRKTEEVLSELRGTKTTCGCGRPLVPCLDENGKQIGVTHTWEDDDWHMEYFSGLRIRRIEEKK